jgi:hypothetical protein
LGYNIRPARFYYNTMTTVNGCARTQNGYGLVEIWKGSIFWLHEFYLSKEVRFDEGPYQKYRELAARVQITPTYFLFQMGTLFFLYHETGHLIQQAGPIGENLEFMAGQCIGPAIAVKHMRELDADSFACHCLAMHIVQFAEVETPNGMVVDPALLAEGAALALAAVYMFFISLSGSAPAIYFEEKCHPHPLVRLSYSVIFLLQNLQGNVPEPIDQQVILTNAIRISEHLMKDPPANIVEAYTLALAGQLDQIEVYIQKIIADTHHYPHLTVHLLDNGGPIA